MLAFLGLTNFSQHFISAYSEENSPLCQLVRGKGDLNLTITLEWTPEMEQAFQNL